MSTFMISYDLWWSEDSSDYKKLTEYFMWYDTRAKPLNTFWFIVANKTTVDIKKEIIEFLDYNDKLIVMNVSNDFNSHYWLPENVVKWIENNI